MSSLSRHLLEKVNGESIWSHRTDADSEPIEILHEWQLHGMNNSGSEQVTTMYSTAFSSDALPDVEFKIYSGIIDRHRFALCVSKTPRFAASVIITILVNNIEKKRVVIDDWVNDHVIDNVRFKFHNGYDYKSALITCVIMWNGFVKDSTSPAPIGLYDLTKHLLTSPDFADIVILIGDEEIPAHKIILAVHSPVFAAMFQTNMKEAADNQIDIKDIDIDIMKKMMEYLYTGLLDANLNVDILLPLLAGADKYQITGLKNLCQEFLCEQITINTALKILEEASLHGVPLLIEAIISFMMVNRKDIAQLEDFERLHNRKPGLFFEFINRIMRE